MHSFAGLSIEDQALLIVFMWALALSVFLLVVAMVSSLLLYMLVATVLLKLVSLGYSPTIKTRARKLRRRLETGTPLVANFIKFRRMKHGI